MEKNKPQIRFKGFEKVWNEKKLFNLADFSKGKGFSKNDLTEKGTPIILYGRLYTNYQTIIKNVETFVEAKDINVFSKGGEVIVPASGETQEDIVRASVVENEKIILGGDLNIIIPNNKLESIFLALTISNGKVYKELVKKAQGKSVVHIRNNDLKEALIPFPDKSEQQKIGTFFENLDKLITEHQQKHSKLKALKKAMLSKMFPQQGQTVPEIRFKGFTGDWIDTELEKIFNFQYGIFNNNPSNGGKYPVYGANGIIGGYTEFNAEDSIVIGHMGEYAGIVLWGEGQHFVTYNGIITKPKNEKIVPKFGYYLLSKMNLRKISDGSGQPFLSYNILNRIKSTYPKSHDEQIAISNYFKNIDHLISNHELQINKLQNIKKAFLAKMFV